MSTSHTALRDLGIQAVNSGGSTGSSWWSGRNDGSLLPSINPSTGEQIAGVYPCSTEDYQRIVKESLEAFRAWRMVPAPKRGEIVRLIGQACARRRINWARSSHWKSARSRRRAMVKCRR